MKTLKTQLISEHKRVHATLFQPTHADGRAILFTHGYGSESSGYAEYARAAAGHGVTSLTVDLLGHGASDGDIESLSIANYLDGLVAAYDFLASQPDVNPTCIGTCAASFGAYLTVHLSQKRQLKSLMLRVPALYPDNLKDVARRDFDTDMVLHSEPDPNNSTLGIVNNFPGMIMIVASEHDNIILPSVIAAYVKASASHGVHKIIHGAQHPLDDTARKVFKHYLVAWAKLL